MTSTLAVVKCILGVLDLGLWPRHFQYSIYLFKFYFFHILKYSLNCFSVLYLFILLFGLIIQSFVLLLQVFIFLSLIRNCCLIVPPIFFWHMFLLLCFLICYLILFPLFTYVLSVLKFFLTSFVYLCFFCSNFVSCFSFFFQPTTQENLH